MREWKRADTEWFKKCGWGVFMHYLCKPETTVEEWNNRIDNFNVETLADQLASAKTPYFFITIGQNSGHFLSPNKTYDEITGITPSKCSNRDLVSDLYDVLSPRGIDLLVYSTCNAPVRDEAACEKLEWHNPATSEDKRLVNFQKKWEAIHREWSERWGNKVRGWWIDGCTPERSDGMHRHPKPPNFQSFAESMKAGNPDAIVAFNGGVNAIAGDVSDYEDYTAGELTCSLPVGDWWGEAFPEYCSYGPIKGDVQGAQLHVLNFLGRWWGATPPRFPTELVVGYTRYINSHGGVVSWDVAKNRDGTIPEAFVEQLKAISKE